MELSSSNESCSFDYDPLELPFQIESKDFIEFAKVDLDCKNPHHLVNSLANTKRAINCQMDSLLYAFGLYNKTKQWRFPQKVKLLNALGIVSPNILCKINAKRNLLEHEYNLPSTEDAEDALDVAILFIDSSKSFLKGNWNIEIANPKGDFPWVDVYLKHEEQKIELRYWLGYKNGKSFFITIDEWDYLYFLDKIITHAKYWQEWSP